MTEYAYHHKELSTRASVLRLYIQRFGRIIPLHWSAIVLDLLYRGHGDTVPPYAIASSLGLVTSWTCYKEWPKGEEALFWQGQCSYWPPNTPHWTLSTLLPAWLLFPLVHSLIR